LLTERQPAPAPENGAVIYSHACALGCEGIAARARACQWHK